MPDEERKEWVRQHAEQYTQEYLENRDNYPLVDGHIAFFDEESYQTYIFKNGNTFTPHSRQSTHLIDLWQVSAYYDGEELVVEANNAKIVDGWRLVGTAKGWKGLLTSGTSYYSIKEGNSRPMNFFDKYRGVWNFNRYGRKGIRGELVDAFNLLIDEAIQYGVGRAIEERILMELEWHQ